MCVSLRVTDLVVWLCFIKLCESTEEPQFSVLIWFSTCGFVCVAVDYTQGT